MSENTSKYISLSSISLLLGRQNLNENNTFEVKRATGKEGIGQVPDDFYPTYSAMANTLGGIVIFGLEETKTKKGIQQYKLIGITNPDKVIDQLFSTLNNKTKVNINLIKPVNIRKIEINNTTLIEITIPRAERTQKPIYLNGNPIKYTYIRNISGDHILSEEEVRQMIKEASSTTIDAEILPDYTIKDLNPQSVLAYRNIFKITNTSHPWNSLNDDEFLSRIKAVNTDRSKKISGVTKAGLLMFGSTQDITDHFPYYYLDYLETHSKDKHSRYDNKISSNQGTWSGNIFDFFRKIDQKLSEDLDIPFRLNGRQRIDESPISEVLREALINTLIHADYTGSAPVKIIKDTEKFEFTNPGDMRRPLALAKEGGISDCRNRILQTMFRHIGYGDQEGFGITTIYTKWKEITGNDPIYEELKYPLITKLTLINKNPETAKEEPTTLLKRNLETAKEEPTTSLKRNLETAKEEPTTLLKRNLKTAKEETSSHTNLLKKLSSETLSKINTLGKRTNRENMNNIIREICSQSEFTIEELCIILNRKDRKALYNNYISKLIKENKLEKTTPEKPNHPNQKYKTILSEKH